jgi:5-methylcytosine-specific restriction enzyme A
VPIPDRKQLKEELIELLNTEGSLKTKTVYEKLAKKWKLKDPDKAAKRSNRPLYQHEIRWARQELKIEGIIEPSEISGRGTWKLAEFTFHEPPELLHVDLSELHYEGAKKSVYVNIYERDRKARQKCLEHFGYSCRACDLNMEELYGLPGKEAIHVHHVVEISSVGKEYVIDPVKDLIPVCPNCHHIIHRKYPAYKISEIRRMLAKKLTNS